MVRRIIPLACVLLVSLAGCMSQGSGAGNGAPPAGASVPPPPDQGVESIAAEAAEVGASGSERDPVYTVASEMERAEANDGCTGAIGDENDVLGCDN